MGVILVAEVKNGHGLLIAAHLKVWEDTVAQVGQFDGRIAL